MPENWLLSTRTFESVCALTRCFNKSKSRDGASWQVFALARGWNQPSLFLVKVDPLPSLGTVHTFSSSSHVARAIWPWCALNTVTHERLHVLGIGLSNPRLVLLGSARECGGFSNETPSGTKSVLADPLTRWEATSQTSSLVGVVLCLVLYYQENDACAPLCIMLSHF